MSDLDAYDYELPRQLVAQSPLANRADARLLVVDRAGQRSSTVMCANLPQLLRPHDLLVLNDTRVLPARLIGFRTATGGHWEGLFLHVDEQGLWRLLARSRGRIAVGETITLADAERRDAFKLRSSSGRKGACG